MGIRRVKESQRKILVVGHHPAIVVSLRTMLTLSHHHVLVTDELEAALTLAEAHTDIALALIDVSAGRAEPRALAQTLRSLRPDLKILFFSSLVDGEVIRLGVLDTVEGVLRREGVVATIQEALGHPVRKVNGSAEGLKTMTAGG